MRKEASSGWKTKFSNVKIWRGIVKGSQHRAVRRMSQKQKEQLKCIAEVQLISTMSVAVVRDSQGICHVAAARWGEWRSDSPGEQGGEEEGGSTCWGLHGPCVGAGDGWLAGFCPQRSYCIAVTGRGQENQSERMVTGSAVGLADGDQGSGARKSERLQPTVVRHPCASRCHLRRQDDL